MAIDVGASKVLLAAFSLSGEVLHEYKFPTPKDYQKFIKTVAKYVKDEFGSFNLAVACCAIPGKVDRKRGIGEVFGNLAWRNKHVKADLQKALGLGVSIENDANLAGLYEALSHKKYRKVLYITLSTGIGDGIIINGKIDSVLADSEAGFMLLEHDGKVGTWEDFASGSALKARYGKLASELDDKSAWQEYAAAVAAGLKELLAVIQPGVVIIGGGVGRHFEKFSGFLEQELAKSASKMVEIPPIIKAKRPEEAVIYGCYEFIKQNG